MVKDNQVRILMKLIRKHKTLSEAALKSGMDEKTARKYRRLGRLPSEVKVDHTWRTREDPFIEVWEEVRSRLEINPGLKEVYFPQKHEPGELCQSDFTYMGSLGVTIRGRPFDHLVYHFVLTYSNWETGTVCFSESFESLSDGLQRALWELGGLPKAHQTDRLSTAVQKTGHPEEFTRRYEALLRHYGLEGRKAGVSKPNEIGDVEQRHFRFKNAVDQALMLRGSRDFESREAYDAFLKKLFNQLNAGRQQRLEHELKVLRRLPARRLDSCKRLHVRVGPSSTIRVHHNTYSVPSRLIGETLEVRLYAEHLEVRYAQRCIDRIPRLSGRGKHRIAYRHIIDRLVRKPGAFDHYRYRDDLFPTHRFRMAYDELAKRHRRKTAAKAYLRILYLAARESENAVDDALRHLIDREQPITAEAVKSFVTSDQRVEPPTNVVVAKLDLSVYDDLFGAQGVAL